MALPQATNAAASAAVAERNKTWVIGLSEAPNDFLPYQSSATAQRAAAPVTELLFPSPVLTLGFGYTTTGVLEKIPTLENGGAIIQQADVFLDAAGNITTTATQVITQVDQLVVTFSWNPKLRWSDGTSVTADDSVFSYEMAKAAPASSEVVDRLSQTVSYEKIDDYTTRATLQPDFTGATYFLNYWTPLPRHLLQNVDPTKLRESEYAKNPIGYGPYAIDERDGADLRMLPNQYYFGSEPPTNKVTITFISNGDLLRAGLLNGNLDVMVSDRLTPEQMGQFDNDSRSGAARVDYIPSPIWEHIDFNLDVQLLQDIRVRQAIALGTDRKAMINALYGGRAPLLDTWVLPGQIETAPAERLTRYSYKPDEARQLLDEAGYAVGPDGIRTTSDGYTLTLQLMTTENSSVREEVARRFQQNMRDIGINVDILSIPSSEMFSTSGPLYLRQFELALFGWGAGAEPGGLSLWGCAAVPSESNGFHGENFAGWCFRDADQAIRKAVTALDANERQEAYYRQQEIWSHELPSLPLFQRLNVVAVLPAIDGTYPDIFAPITWNITTWKRES